MKIVLVNPPRWQRRPYFLALQMPLNIAYLAAYLRKRDFEVEIWDFEVEKFTDGLFIERLKEAKPQIIGFSCFTPAVLSGHHLALLVKQNYPQIITVAGGVHVSATPKRSLREFTSFDYLVIGEGEETFFEFCQKVRAKGSLQDIKGLIGRENIEFKTRPLIANLDKIPFPARDLLKLDLYKGATQKGFSRSYLNIVEIFTARGCPYECIFCASQVTMGRRVRFRSVDNICEEISDCIQKYKINHVTFLDDTFTLKSERVKRLCRYLKKKNLTWNATGTRVNTVDKELLGKMAESGCIGLAFGVESGSQHILDLIKKEINLKQVRSAFKWTREAGIKSIEADFIIGSHPDETEDDLSLTRKLIKELKPDILSVAYIVPYPGTETNRLMKERGLLPEIENWNDFMLFSECKPPWRTTYFSSEDLFKLQRKLLSEHYFTPSYVFKKMTKIRSLGEFCYWGKSALEFMKLSFFKRKSV